MTLQTRSADRESVRIYGENGPRVVMVHGSLAVAEAAFSEQLPLAAQCRLEIVTRRGYGTRQPVDRVDIEADAQELARILDGGAHLVGTSMGGIVALHAAALVPDQVNSLTLIEPPAFVPSLDIAEVQSLATEIRQYYARAPFDLRDFAMGFLEVLGVELDLPLELPAEMARAFSNLRSERPWHIDIPLGVVAAASMPKLVVAGSWSAAFDAMALRLAQLIGAEFARVPGAGHAAQKVGSVFNQRLLANIDAGSSN